MLELVFFDLLILTSRTKKFIDQNNISFSRYLAATKQEKYTKNTFNGISPLPKTSSYKKGDIISVNIHLETGTESVNAAEILLKYPSDILSLEKISVNSSAFDVKVKTEDNKDDVKVIVGATKPQSGSVSIATIEFRAINPGKALVTFDPSSQVLSATTHKNVLQNIGDTVYTVE